MSSEWLQFIFSANYLEPQLNAEAKGTTGYAAVRPKTLLSATIPLPPLAEQHRIVSRIGQIITLIRQAKVLRESASKESDNLSQAIVEEEYQRLATEFGLARLTKLCATITDGDHNTPPFADDGVRFIFVGNVSSGYLHFRDAKRVGGDYFNSLRPQRVPKRGDILYSAVGAWCPGDR